MAAGPRCGRRLRRTLRESGVREKESGQSGRLSDQTAYARFRRTLPWTPGQGEGRCEGDGAPNSASHLGGERGETVRPNSSPRASSTPRPPPVATLSESKPAAMGMRTPRQRARTAADKPGPSAPTTRATPMQRFDLGHRLRALRRQGDGREPGGDEALDDVLVRAAARPRRQERCAHRDAERLAVERVAAALVQQHGVDAKSGGVAEQAAHVVVVADPAGRQDEGALR